MVRSVSPSMFFHGTPMAQTTARKTSESLIMVHVQFTIRTVPMVGHPAAPAGVKFDILLLCQSFSSKTPERQSERGLTCTCCMQILIVTAQEHSYCIHALHLVRRT